MAKLLCHCGCTSKILKDWNIIQQQTNWLPGQGTAEKHQWKIWIYSPAEWYHQGCSHVLWTGAVFDKASTARECRFYGDKAIDPQSLWHGHFCTYGTMVCHGQIKNPERSFSRMKASFGSTFTDRIEEETSINGIPAIKPNIWRMGEKFTAQYHFDRHWRRPLCVGLSGYLKFAP